MDNHILAPEPQQNGGSESKQAQSHKLFDSGIEASGASLTEELFEKYKQAVFQNQPNLEALYAQIGTIPFYSYAKSHIRENRNKVIKARKSEFIDVVKEEVWRVLGSEIAESVEKQLKSNDSISTVQHHAPLGHPDTLNATLQNALPYFGANGPEYQNVLVFACAGVSFNNAKFPRGHLFHTLNNGELVTEQFTFFGHTVDPRPVMYHHAYDYEDIVSAKNALSQMRRDGDINEITQQKINALIDNIYRSPHALSLNDYTDQITVTNYYLFREIFKGYKKYVPNLVFLAQENIALNLLLKYHLQNPTSIHRMIFESEVLDLVEKNFNGIQGAFSKKDKEGTVLFWGMPQGSKLRVQLWRNGNFLEDKDGVFRIELAPNKIKEAILNRELIPSVMLSFVIIACYYGFFLGGGHFQTEYLTQMKNAYSKVMEKIGESESLEAVEGLTTTNFVIPRPTMVYLRYQNKRIPATGLDMILYASEMNWNNVIEGTKRASMGDVIARMFPELFSGVSGGDELDRINERDIEIFKGLDKKILEIAEIT